MSLPYPIAASQTDANSPVDQTLMDAIRLDLDDLDSRVSSALTHCDENLLSDFTHGGSVVDSTRWVTGSNGGGYAAPAVTTASGSHYVQASGVASTAGQSCMRGSDTRIRVYAGVDCSFAFECRVKISTAGDNGRRGLLGWQDVALSETGSVNILTDVTDFIGFIQGTNNQTLKFTMQKGGVSGASVDNLGSLANWTKVKVTVSRASGVYAVHAYLDDVEISGSPFSTNVPDSLSLRPAFAVGNDTGVGNAMVWRVDRCRFYWITPPDSP